MNPQSTIDPSAPENPNPPPEFSTAQFTKSGGKVKKILISLLVILLIAGGIYGGYSYGKGQNKDRAKSSVQPAATPPASQSSSAVHFVKSDGFPLDSTSHKTFSINLGVPGEFQAVRVSTTSGNRGQEQYFTDKFNDELGRWIFGDPTDGDANGSGENGVSVLAISNSWLGATTKQGPIAYGNDLTELPLSTPADKQKFLKAIKANSETCAKDSKKGFATTDGSFKICNVFSFGHDAYSPLVSFSGYGEKDNIPMYFTGGIRITDDTPMPNRDAENKAIENSKNGKYTAKFSASLSTLIAALKQTTLTTADNPNKTN
jgi:hypothetical protein